MRIRTLIEAEPCCEMATRQHARLGLERQSMATCYILNTFSQQKTQRNDMKWQGWWLIAYMSNISLTVGSPNHPVFHRTSNIRFLNQPRFTMVHQKDQPKQMPWGFICTNAAILVGFLMPLSATYEHKYIWIRLSKKETLTITKQMLKCPWLKPNVSQRAHCKQHLPMVQASLSLFLTCAFTWEHGPMGNQFNFFLGNWMAIEHCYGKSPCFKGTWSISWAFPASHSYVSVLEGMNFGFHHLSSFFTSKISPSLVEVPLIALDMRQLGHHDFTERTSPQGIPCFNQSLGHFSEMRVLPPWII